MATPPNSVPLATDAVLEPVYVNAKQYHGILRRRQSRAKAESQNKANKTRKVFLKAIILPEVMPLILLVN